MDVMSTADVVEGAGINGTVVKEWLTHPVTKVVALVIVLEVGYQYAMRKGARVLGLIEDAASE